VLKAFDGGRLFGSVHGVGPPAVLALHGWGRTSADFDAVLGGLDAVALDLPGFGATPPPAEPWGATGYAAAVAPVLGEAAGPVVVLGHSFGGRVAVHLAAAHPDEVAGLVLTGAPLVRPAARLSPTGWPELRTGGACWARTAWSPCDDGTGRPTTARRPG
jgi:pimeloyl-ACP methyl ester carboxylesterase